MGSKAEETKDALIGAVVEMLATQSLRSISAREVAARAGVNHGLVHRHFGSRDGLIQAAVQRLSMNVHRGDAGPGMSAPTFRYLRANPHLARLIGRACLDGPPELVAKAAPDAERLAEIVAPVERWLDRLGLTQGLDPHVLNGLASAAFLGWVVFRPLLDAGFGLPEDADDQLEAVLEKLDAMVAASAPRK